MAGTNPSRSPHRLCAAPMMDWTDRHCRYFLRQCAPHARLYTEMITTGALLHGDAARHLAFDPAEHPVAAQLGGSEPAELAACARLVETAGYDEVNLNIGCPSERVQRGAFGACLMAEPELVADCVRALREAVSIPVTVKHRIGVDKIESYDFVAKFVATVAAAGCTTFIVHARNAVLKGLSPKENRELPPLRYEVVHRLKLDFPRLGFIINGGFTDWGAIEAQLALVDGVMLGRAAYHQPWLLAEADARLYGDGALPRTRAEVAQAMAAYAARQLAAGVALRQVTRHMLGLYHHAPRARQWRRMLSDPARLAHDDPALIGEALEAVELGLEQAA
ncbi:MAG TPA: tRNA dihydrouridine(20/20a) synthase DusA [Burkholderiales bacterium]|nr:tRNA dihydrouridine(20/20a) synthase DusA [Burkholderiales bacterium]